MSNLVMYQFDAWSIFMIGNSYQMLFTVDLFLGLFPLVEILSCVMPEWYGIQVLSWYYQNAPDRHWSCTIAERHWSWSSWYQYTWVYNVNVHRVFNYFTLFTWAVKLAKLQTDAVLMAPCQTRILYPRIGGNLHCFTAVTPCAVLDVLAPPYNEAAGRSCTYYRDFPFSSFR